VDICSLCGLPCFFPPYFLVFHVGRRVQGTLEEPLDLWPRRAPTLGSTNRHRVKRKLTTRCPEAFRHSCAGRRVNARRGPGRGITRWHLPWVAVDLLGKLRVFRIICGDLEVLIKPAGSALNRAKMKRMASTLYHHAYYTKLIRYLV